jgi:hypothetical protein
MTWWTHLRETLRDPSVWRDVYKNLLTDGIKYVLGLTVTFWLGSKLNPNIAAAWDAVTGAFGPVWQGLWRPVGVPLLIVAITLVLVAMRLLHWWRARNEPDRIRVVVEPAQPPAPEQPPPPVGDLDERQKLALMFLYSGYPGSVAMRRLADQTRMSYGAFEQLAQGFERLRLVKIFANPYEGAEIVLTQPGRDLCIERGFDIIA